MLPAAANSQQVTPPENSNVQDAKVVINPPTNSQSTLVVQDAAPQESTPPAKTPPATAAPAQEGESVIEVAPPADGNSATIVEGNVVPNSANVVTQGSTMPANCCCQPNRRWPALRGYRMPMGNRVFGRMGMGRRFR